MIRRLGLAFHASLPVSIGRAGIYCLGSEDPAMSVNMRTARPARDLVVKPGELVMCGGKLSKIVSCVAPDKIHVKTEGSAEFRWVGVGELATYEHLERKTEIRHVSQSDPVQEAAARNWARALGQAIKKKALDFPRRLVSSLLPSLASRQKRCGAGGGCIATTHCQYPSCQACRDRHLRHGFCHHLSRA